MLGAPYTISFRPYPFHNIQDSDPFLHELAGVTQSANGRFWLPAFCSPKFTPFPFHDAASCSMW